MHRISTFVTACRTSWLLLAAATLASCAVFALGSGTDGETAPGAGLPAAAESALAAAAQEDLPGADATSALFVFSRDGAALREADIEAVGAAAIELGKSAAAAVPPP